MSHGGWVCLWGHPSRSGCRGSDRPQSHSLPSRGRSQARSIPAGSARDQAGLSATGMWLGVQLSGLREHLQRCSRRLSDSHRHVQPCHGAVCQHPGLRLLRWWCHGETVVRCCKSMDVGRERSNACPSALLVNACLPCWWCLPSLPAHHWPDLHRHLPMKGLLTYIREHPFMAFFWLCMGAFLGAVVFGIPWNCS